MRIFFSYILLLYCSILGSQNVDIRILDAINSPCHKPIDGTMKFISNSESTISIGLPLTIGIIGIFKRDTGMFENAIFMCGAAVAANGIAYFLKLNIDRTRPYDKYPFIYNKIHESSSSFPSGHTTAAFATATSLSLAYPKWYIIAPSFLWASGVAYSRLHLGVHYPSDIAGGIVIATSSAYISYKVNNWLLGKVKKKKPNWFL